MSSNHLFTTNRNCDAWVNRGAWRAANFTTFCISNIYQARIVHRHCKHKPSLPIQYSDISRLLILYERGGWYVDSDVTPTTLSAKSVRYPTTTFGLESNFSVKKAHSMGMLPQSLAMWAIFGVEADEQLKDMACTLAHMSSEQKPAFESMVSYIHRTSGPTAYTRLWRGKALSVNIFGCGQLHSNSPPCAAPTCWGCHRFANSWL